MLYKTAFYVSFDLINKQIYAYLICCPFDVKYDYEK